MTTRTLAMSSPTIRIRAMTSKSEPGGGCGNGDPLRTQSAKSLPWMSSEGGDEGHARGAP